MFVKPKIEVSLDKPRLLPGESTSVRVKVTLPCALKIRGIYADCRGEEQTLAKYTTKTNGRVRTETARQYVEIFSQNHVLFGAQRMGFLSRIFDSLAAWFGGGVAQELPEGESDFTFDVTIPEDAPPSFMGVKCSILNRIVISIDLPIRSNISHKEPFVVRPDNSGLKEIRSIHVVYPDDTGRSLLDLSFGKDVTLDLAIDRDAMHAGETASAMLIVNSDQPLKFNKIEANLIGKEKSKARFHRDSHHDSYPLVSIDAPTSISQESAFEFNVQIPANLGPPTATGKYFSVQWWIEVRLDVSWAKDPVIKIPMKIYLQSDDA